MILLVAEVNEYKANPDKRARGTVIEAELDKGRGPSCTYPCTARYIESRRCVRSW